MGLKNEDNCDRTFNDFQLFKGILQTLMPTQIQKFAIWVGIWGLFNKIIYQQENPYLFYGDWQKTPYRNISLRMSCGMELELVLLGTVLSV